MAGPNRTLRVMTPDDLHRLESVTAVTLHPTDGSVVFTISRPDGELDRNRSSLWAVEPDRPARQLIHGDADTGAVFSPDGGRLAFIRSAPGSPAEVLVLDWRTRTLHAAASFADGVGDLQWLDDARLVALAARRPRWQRELDDADLARRPRTITRLDYRMNGRGWTHDRRRQPVIIPASPDERPTTDDRSGDGGSGSTDGRATSAVQWLEDLVEDGPYAIDAVDHQTLACSPDGTALVVVVGTEPDDDLQGTNAVWLHPVDGSGPPRPLTPTGGVWGMLGWHPDGPVVALGRFDGRRYGFSRPHLLRIDGDPGVEPGPPQLIGPHDANVVPTIGPRGGLVCVDGAVLTSGPRRGTVAVDAYRLDDGSREAVAEGPFQVLAFDASADGEQVVGAVTTLDRPAELWRLAPGTPEPLVTLNEAILAELDLAVTEPIEVPSTDGAVVHAFLTRPPASAPGPEPDGTRPGLVYVHGGPLSMYGHSFFDEFQLAAAAGHVVVGGNPRGSDGYGEDWATSIVGRLGTDDWDDVQALTDRLADEPGVDPDRIGIGGGSYGGFMASWAIGHTDRYRAALVERAVTSWYSMLGTSDIGHPFGTAMIDATIDDDLEAVMRQSPLTYAGAVTTPTLILHSEEDWRCPIEQAEQYFTALRRNGVEVTLLRFPGENHELSRSGRPSNRVDRFDAVHAFFDRHLRPDPGH